MPVKYDPGIIITFAERLYAQARNIVALYAMTGAVFGVIAGAISGKAMFDDFTVMAILGLILFGLLGFAAGQARAFALRLQAQVALCQVQIEANTRSPGVRLVA